MKKLIILLMMFAGMAQAQSTSGWQTVVTDGTSLSTNGTPLQTVFLPAFGELDAGGEEIDALASSVIVTDGTIASGSVTSTWAIDDVYLQVQESGQFKIDYTFTNILGNPEIINHVGRYDGNPSHNVKLKIWDYTSAVFTNVTGNTTDFPDSSEDNTLSFELSNPSAFVSSGISTVRVEHISIAQAANNFYTDFIDVLPAQLALPTNGVFQVITNMSEGICSNTTCTGSAGTIQIDHDGVYRCHIGGTGTGSTNTTFTLRLFEAGVESDIWFSRTISEAGDIGNAHSMGFLSLTNGTILDIRAKSTRDDSFLTFLNFHFQVHKIGN